MKRFAIILVLACTLAACALRKQERVSANPPEFSAPRLGSTEAESTAESQLALRETIRELRQQVGELRLLFKLRSSPLNEDGAGTEDLPQVRTKPLAVTPLNARANTPSRIGVPVESGGATPTNKVAPATATYSTLFRFASAALDDQARASLAAVRPQLLQADRIDLSAYADPSGQATANVRLAQSRALVVKQELLRLGVPESRIAVRSYVVESRPPQLSTVLGSFGSSDALTRRVDLALRATPSASR